MITLPNPSILESATLTAAEAAHHFATVIKTGWQAFWNRDPETVQAELHDDLPKTLAIFALNTQAAESVNALLDAVNDPRFSNRAPAELPPHWSFDGTEFVYAPPEPIEEPIISDKP
jgi:hypothetical protein